MIETIARRRLSVLDGSLGDVSDGVHTVQVDSLVEEIAIRPQDDRSPETVYTVTVSGRVVMANGALSPVTRTMRITDWSAPEPLPVRILAALVGPFALMDGVYCKGCQS